MKVKELIKLLKTVDQDREVAYTDGMLIGGIHGVVDDDAVGCLDDVPNPVILSPFTFEEELENAQIEVEMWRGRAEDQKEELEKARGIKNLLKELVKNQDEMIEDREKVIENQKKVIGKLKGTFEAPETEELDLEDEE